MNRAALLILIFLIFSPHVFSQLKIYKAPDGMALNDDFSVKVRQPGKGWQPLPIYMARVAGNVGVDGRMHNENTSFCYFDFSGVVEVMATYNKGIVKNARVRPFLGADSAKISGNVISFKLMRPRNLSIEVNGDIFHNLQLFANSLAKYHVNPNDTRVMYFGPGIHQIDTVTLKSNTTVYIDGGAVLRGSFKIDHANNVKILGHGIIEHSPMSVEISYSRNVTIDGPIVLNPRHYTTTIGQSDSIFVRNIKSFSSEGWGDGIDIFCSSHVTLENLFMRNSDDCIAIYGHRWKWFGNTTNITVSNAILWADVAHPILIGTHGDTLHPDTLGDMKFTNIDIMEQNENQINYQGCIALNAGDNNLIRNIRFENIRIDDFKKGQFVNLRVMYNRKYNTSPGRGIENIYFKNVTYTGIHANTAIISGYNEDRKIQNIVFENLILNGKVISDTMPDKPGFYKTTDMANIFEGEHVEGLRFISTEK
ncbi:Glycosyl hydrolases family 28 [Mucilaginibacter mallensis]|uniref:Glycosyl hydrolases family 28 n=1 Tax=Mucilaginibacter mallensis TaxID=652787 RepID=A0A1H1ZSJ4_MUCMA|nr:glycosyl hydrolase family 28 protein [Mucilaginibacter mallensis]SDT36630.1 Glycosyl hydrolases family 28 [Mucilaginibacter mallensis]